MGQALALIPATHHEQFEQTPAPVISLQLEQLRRVFNPEHVYGNITDEELFFRAYSVYRKGAPPHPYMEERLAADLQYYKDTHCLPTFVLIAHRDLCGAA